MQKKGYTIPLKKKIPLTQVFYSVLCSIINIPQNFKISNYLCNLNPFFYIVTLYGEYSLSRRFELRWVRKNTPQRGVGEYSLSRWFELRRVRKNTPQGGVLVYPLGFLSRKAVLCVRSRSRLPIGVRLSRPYKALSTLCLTGNSSHPRRRIPPLAMVRTSAGTKKHPAKGCFGVPSDNKSEPSISSKEIRTVPSL